MAVCLGKRLPYFGLLSRHISYGKGPKIEIVRNWKKSMVMSGVTVICGSGVLWLAYQEYRRMSSVNALSASEAKLKHKVNEFQKGNCTRFFHCYLIELSVVY